MPIDRDEILPPTILPTTEIKLKDIVIAKLKQNIS